MQPTYLSVKEFAAQCFISTQAVYKRIPTDLQPYIKMDGKQKTISTEAFKFFLPFEPQPMQPPEPTEPTETMEFLIMQHTADMETIKALTDHIKYMDDKEKERLELATANKDQLLLKQQPEEPKKKPFWKLW